jgi:hypothetical protein
MTEGDAGPDRERQTRLLGGRISCAIGLLLGAGGVFGALLGGGVNVSPGALGIGFCILGYFLDSRKLATATIFLCAASILFGLAASQGLIPGIAPSNHALPSLSAGQHFSRRISL